MFLPFILAFVFFAGGPAAIVETQDNFANTAQTQQGDVPQHASAYSADQVASND